jgi:hypothetical protein
MGMLAETFVRVRPDTSRLSADAKSAVEKPMREAGEAGGKKFSEGMTASIIKGFVGINLLRETGDVIVDFVKESVNAAREAATAVRLTDAVIKSTGGVARVSGKQVEDYALQLSNLTGVHKDVIQSGENVLLTFTSIRNKVGQGNDIFNQATLAALNMSKALGTDMQSSVIQLGKALNNPLQGMTALRRVGVSFTEDQAKLIKRLQDSGNLMGAQKVILKEVATEFGGAAAASTDFGAKAFNSWHNLQEELGGLVLPIVQRVGTAFAAVLVPAIVAMIDAFKTGEAEGRGLVGLFASIGVAVNGLITGFRTGAGEVDGVRGEFANLGIQARFVFEYVRQVVVPVLHDAARGLIALAGWLFSASASAGLVREVLAAIVAGLIVYNTYVRAAALATKAWEIAVTGYRTAAFLAIAATQGWTAAQEALDGALIANPIGAIIVLVAALVAGVVYAWFHFRGFRVFLIDTWKVIKTGALDVWHGGIEPAFHGIATVALWLWNNVLYPSFEGWRIIIMQGIVPAAMWLWHNVIEPAFKGISAAIRVAWTLIGPVLDLFGFIISKVLAPIILWLWHNIIEKAFQAIWIVIQIAWNIIKTAFDGWVFYFQHILGPLITWFWHTIIEPAWNAISKVIDFGWTHLIKPALDALGFIIEHVVAPAFSRGVDAIKRAWALVEEAAKTPINFVIGFINSGIIHPFNSIASFFGVKDRIGDIPKLAVGGLFRGVGGPRDDKNLVALSDREFVVNAKSTSKWLPVLEWINSQGRKGQGPRTKYPGDGSFGIRAFADGGLVGWLSSIGSDIVSFISNPGSAITAFADRLLSGIPGGATLQAIIAGMGHKLIDGLVHWVTATGTAQGGSAGAFLRAQVGKPYIWASAGPNGYDCSGIVSAVWNLLHGRNPYVHTFSTMNEAGFFPLPGFGGALSAGWTNPGEPGPGGNSVGHTAGVLLIPGLGPIPFESTGSSGVHIGASVTPLSAFAHIGHFDAGGRWPTGTLGANTSGRTEYVASADAMDQLLALVRRLIAAVEQVAPGVGAHISGVGSSIRRIARAT